MITKVFKILPGSIKNRILSELKIELLEGENVECNICNRKFITFLPAGVIRRPNALCPCCGSLERHRMIWHFFINKTNLFSKKISLLHVAPEKNYFKIFNDSDNINYFPCAKFDDEINDPYPKGTENIDITDIPYTDNYFDVIYCSHVLEHIPGDIDAMKELYRVLKDDGWAVLQVPIDKSRENTFEDFNITRPDERERLFGQKDHVRVYGRDYPLRLESVGFKVNIISYYKQFSKNELFKYGFIEEDIFYCTK